MAVLGVEIADRYRLDRRLGAGGMSTVFVARDQVLEREVAVKLLAEHLAEDDGFVARFRREALAAAKLVHPNIVQVYDSGRDPETHRHYIVMEYVEGRSVAELLREQERLSVEEAVDIGVQACNGLDYAHRHGVIHRDVKPGNLIINSDGVVKLADFGIAKAAEDSKITQIGSVLGTAAYLSPERTRGEEATAELGRLLARRRALPAAVRPGPLRDRLADRARPAPAGGRARAAARLNPEVGPSSSRAVTRCLAARPEHRYASAAEMREAIEEGARGRDSAVTMRSRRRPRGSRPPASRSCDERAAARRRRCGTGPGPGPVAPSTASRSAGGPRRPCRAQAAPPTRDVHALPGAAVPVPADRDGRARWS